MLSGKESFGAITFNSQSHKEKNVSIYLKKTAVPDKKEREKKMIINRRNKKFLA